MFALKISLFALLIIFFFAQEFALLCLRSAFSDNCALLHLADSIAKICALRTKKKNCAPTSAFYNSCLHQVTMESMTKQLGSTLFSSCITSDRTIDVMMQSIEIDEVEYICYVPDAGQ